jgi:hypothetical protein
MFLTKNSMKAASTTVLAVLLGLYLPAAFAAKTDSGPGPIEIERPDGILTETDTSLSAPVRDRQAAGGKTLRCWQYGRLLYESSGFARLAASDKTAVTVNRQAGDGVSIINLQDGLCILSDR